MTSRPATSARPTSAARPVSSARPTSAARPTTSADKKSKGTPTPEPEQREQDNLQLRRQRRCFSHHKSTGNFNITREDLMEEFVPVINLQQTKKDLKFFN